VWEITQKKDPVASLSRQVIVFVRCIWRKGRERNTLKNYDQNGTTGRKKKGKPAYEKLRPLND